ncbi:MAG: mannose-1-phosphate guanylyltransferase, partial [Ignavibacteriales bacterium]
MELYAVIMAGGVGSRFWPRSKKKKPDRLSIDLKTSQSNRRGFYRPASR